MTDRSVKSTWVTRHAPLDVVDWRPVDAPTIGDLVLCEVRKIGVHGRVETVSGSRERLFAGDRIVCALGNRYATSLLHAVGHLRGTSADMVSASGLCGTVVNRNKKAASLTELEVLGQAFLGDTPLNLRACTIDRAPAAQSEPRWVVVVGSAMDSGKTTVCTSIIHGLARIGIAVGAGKVTGTASARDLGSFRDAGARPYVDFLDFGWPSTAGCAEPDLIDVFDRVTGALRGAGVEWAVVEIADGLLMPDTRFLLDLVAGRLGASARVVLTVREALAAVAGVELLRARGLEVSAVSGLVTNSPMSCVEVEDTTGVVCVPTNELGRQLAKEARSLVAVPPAPAEVTSAPA